MDLVRPAHSSALDREVEQPQRLRFFNALHKRCLCGLRSFFAAFSQESEMLVLSRRADERIVLPELGISFTIVQIKGSKVRVGIEAPKSIRIIRGELDRIKESSESTSNTPSRGLASLAKTTHSLSRSGDVNFSRIPQRPATPIDRNPELTLPA